MRVADDGRSARPLAAGPLLLWCGFLLGIPFYVFADGLPQPAYIVLPFIGLLILAGPYREGRLRFAFEYRQILVCLTLFVLYTVLVPLVWFLWLGQAPLLVFPAFYLFNLVVFWVALSLRAIHGAAFDVLTEKVMVLAIMLQVALLPVVWSTADLRQALFFNNPNQLGYYALLANTTLFVLHERTGLPRRWIILGSAGAFLLGVVSVSRSALSAMALLLLIGARHRPKRLLVMAAAIGLAGCVTWLSLPPLARERLFLQTRGATDSLAGRGYDRMINHPEYLLFGAGEGGFERFESALTGEIHSSFGTILFAYGIPGLVLFSSFLCLILRRCGATGWLLFLPALTYGFTHQGLRFVMFWVLVGVACTPSSQEQARAR